MECKQVVAGNVSTSSSTKFIFDQYDIKNHNHFYPTLLTLFIKEYLNIYITDTLSFTCFQMSHKSFLLPPNTDQIQSSDPKRFRRVLQTITTPSCSNNTNIKWDITSPPSPIDFEAAAKDRKKRCDRVCKYVQKAMIANDFENPLKVTQDTDLDPPPANKYEVEYQSLKKQIQIKKRRLRRAYAEIHLRMYMLDMLRPSDYIIKGSLDESLHSWQSMLDEDHDL